MNEPCHYLICRTSIASFCLSDDRHRVKLHSLLADPSSDYVNANYIDVSHSRVSCGLLLGFLLGSYNLFCHCWVWSISTNCLNLSEPCSSDRTVFWYLHHIIALQLCMLKCAGFGAGFHRSDFRDPTRAPKLGVIGPHDSPECFCKATTIEHDTKHPVLSSAFVWCLDLT